MAVGRTHLLDMKNDEVVYTRIGAIDGDFRVCVPIALLHDKHL